MEKRETDKGLGNTGKVSKVKKGIAQGF